MTAAGQPREPEERRSGAPARGPDDRKRSPRAIRTAARSLQREARRILRKHGGRIAAEPADAIRASAAAIDTLHGAEDWAKLETEAEHLDELLHQHASFARKSAWRETVENVLIAVAVALGLRSCFYEPFKIPSSSMMPTLRAGDHIFVNKFAYGIQIPFTSTVVGESLGHVERGDVIVFRYPLDDNEDFIKRVIGLPGDEVRVAGRAVAIKRADADAFEELERVQLHERCVDDTGTKTLPNCQLFEETLGGKTYVVQYTLGSDDRDQLAPPVRSWKVPEGHLLVMGDNRNMSHDSLAWTVTVEAVDATKVLSLKDLRDLTSDNMFTVQDSGEVATNDDGRHDQATYLASHRSSEHDLGLSVWRDPTLGLAPVFDSTAAGIPGAHPSTVAELVAAAPAGVDRDRAGEVGAGIDRLVVGGDATARHALVLLEGAKAVLHLRCGTGVCADDASLGLRVAEVVGKFHGDHGQDVRNLIEQPRQVRYTTQWSGRGDGREHFFERRLAKPGAKGPRDEVRFRAFRRPAEGAQFVRDAALRSLGGDIATASRVAELGDEAYAVEGGDRWNLVIADLTRDVVVLLECGKSACPSQARLLEIGRAIGEGIGPAAGDRRKLRVMFTSGDVPGWEEVPVGAREQYEFDQIALEGTVRGREHSLDVEVWLRPDEGIAGKLAAVGAADRMQPDTAVAPGGLFVTTDDAFVAAFAVDASQSVVRIACHRGLCSDKDAALALAHRAAGNVAVADNFIDPAKESPRPFVPRGNVKGRAERIWLPLSRFWLPIR